MCVLKADYLKEVKQKTEQTAEMLFELKKKACRIQQGCKHWFVKNSEGYWVLQLLSGRTYVNIHSHTQYPKDH